MIRSLDVLHVHIFDNTARVATVVIDEEGNRARHGLGVVGEPVAPYLGARTPDYAIEFLTDLRDLRVYLVDTSTKTSSGLYRTIRGGAASLGAPDIDIAAGVVKSAP